MEQAVSSTCDRHAERFACPDALLSYSSKFDEYGIIVHDGGAAVIAILFCPWCGTKLPDSKRDRRLDDHPGGTLPPQETSPSLPSKLIAARPALHAPGSGDLADNPTVVLQRVRNRIIEYLELASSFEAQRKYQERVPQVSVPDEVINQWEDWVTDPPFDDLCDPTFSLDERAAMRDFHAIWTAIADDIPCPSPPLADVVLLYGWQRLRDAASVALKVFMVRGKFSESA